MTIDLEKELIRQNRKLATPQELLQIREFELNQGMLNNDVLERLQMNTSLLNGKQLKQEADSMHDATKNFKQERVFHISQIEALCKKYYLRFLSSSQYAGSIDPELPNKVTTFEAAYNVKIADQNRNRAYIAAPKESFRLQAKPKDPLLFYKINSDYYYLVHKWGNDLSIFRRLLSVLSTPMLPQIISFALGLIVSIIYDQGWVSLAFGIFATLGMTLAMLIKELIIGPLYNDWTGPCPHIFIRPNEWDSEFDD